MRPIGNAFAVGFGLLEEGRIYFLQGRECRRAIRGYIAFIDLAARSFHTITLQGKRKRRRTHTNTVASI
jgi:hypothetical protein